jgi:exopolyphosphatase/guanosine-5'-triphosphate,3'-diphosphate pyrophosphatase
LKASVIDLGYNSLKMVSYEIGRGNSFRAYEQKGALTKLGEGLHETGFLSRESMERTVRELRLLRELCELERVDKVLPIATSPVREAVNGDEFLRMARDEVGLRFKVLSGNEEALFSYIGAVRAIREPNALFFDLGGGSLELAYARGYRIRRTMSLPLGALRMTELYGNGGKKFQKKEYERMSRTIEELLPRPEQLGLGSDTVLVGVGGSIRAIARYDQFLRDYPLNKLHNYVMRRKAVVSIHKRLRKMGTQKIARLEVFGKDRAESITAGSLVIAMLMGHLQMDRVVVSTHGLRDGILAEYLRSPASHFRKVMTEARAYESLSGLLVRNSWTESFTRSLASGGVVTSTEKRILDEAAEHFLDTYLSTRAESLFYSIMGEDSSLEHGDQVALALSMVRAKSQKIANWFYPRYESVLDGRSKESIERLAALVQLTGLLRESGSRATVRLRGRRLLLLVNHTRRNFPDLPLGEMVREMKDATALRVSPILSRSHAARVQRGVRG